MSQENVNVMRQAFQAFAGADMAALVGLLDPDVEWKAVEDPEPKLGQSWGSTAYSSPLERGTRFGTEVHGELEELIDAGTDVVAVVNMRGRHAESQGEVTERFFQVWTIREHKIVRFHEYRTRRDALEIAGLPE